MSLSILTQPQNDTLYVLDIDSTLVATHQRNQSIINDFCQKYEAQFSQDCSVLAKARCRYGDYGFKSALERIHFEAHDKNFRQALDLFWRENFFSNRYLHHDEPTPGAVPWVNTLHQLKVPYFYLTARHKETMWDGTLETMNKMGFPITESSLELKLNPLEKDELYKVQALQNRLTKSGLKRVAFIDNEPVVLHAIQDHYQKTIQLDLVWFDSCHSGKKAPPTNAFAIKDFLF